MASNTLGSTALLFTFNLIFLTLVSSTELQCAPPPMPLLPPTPHPDPVPPTPMVPSPIPPMPTVPLPAPPIQPPVPSTAPCPPTLPTPPIQPPVPSIAPCPPTLPTPPIQPPVPSIAPSPPTLPTPPIPSTPPCPPTEPSVSPLVPTPSPMPSKESCSVDTLKLGVCGNVLGGLIGIIVGTPANSPCCTLIGGLADLDAAVCLCTAIKANVLGINLNVPVSLSLLLNYCGKEAPSGFQCA